MSKAFPPLVLQPVAETTLASLQRQITDLRALLDQYLLIDGSVGMDSILRFGGATENIRAVFYQGVTTQMIVESLEGAVVLQVRPDADDLHSLAVGFIPSGESRLALNMGASNKPFVVTQDQSASFDGIPVSAGPNTGGPSEDFQLVIPVKTTAGDPTGAGPGAVYYNSNDDLWRKWDGSAWSNW